MLAAHFIPPLKDGCRPWTVNPNAKGLVNSEILVLGSQEGGKNQDTRIPIPVLVKGCRCLGFCVFYNASFFFFFFLRLGKSLGTEQPSQHLALALHAGLMARVSMTLLYNVGLPRPIAKTKPVA